jgi:cell division protein FtsW (lipid II flippase)
MRRDWIAGISLLGLSGAYYWIATQIPRSQLSDVVGAASYPKLLAIVLAILSLFLVVSGVLTKPPVGENQKEKHEEDKKEFLKAGGTILIGIGYLIVIKWTGYAIAVTLLMIAMLMYNHEKLSWKSAGISIIGGVFFWFVFAFLFDIPVPEGVWLQWFQG